MHPGVTGWLEVAREARRRSDGQAVLLALREATALAQVTANPEDLQVAGWRLAKAEHDFGDAAGILTALDLVLASSDPFRHHPSALAAAEPLSRKIWDSLGYGHEQVPRMWRAFTDHHEALGDNWMAGQGTVQRAWHFACRGDLGAVATLSDPWFRLTPGRFGRGPTKHPDAEDATLSLYWLQADLARIALRGATWAGAEPLAHDARDQLLDALAASGRAADSDAWVVDCHCRAADRFRWDAAPWPTWRRVLDRWAEILPAHAARGHAVLRRRVGNAEAARADLLAAANQAEQEAIGWEWVIDALEEAQRIRSEQHLAERIQALRVRTAVGIG